MRFAPSQATALPMPIAFPFDRDCGGREKLLRSSIDGENEDGVHDRDTEKDFAFGIANAHRHVILGQVHIGVPVGEAGLP